MGVAKVGVVKSDHAIIYTGTIAPEPRIDELPNHGETGMRLASIQVEPASVTDRLDPVSRVDLGDVHKVQHNIKVKSLGTLTRSSTDDLLTQFWNVWQERIRSRPFGDRRADGKEDRQVRDDAFDDDDDDENSSDDEEDDDEEEAVEDSVNDG
jgi:hypothetical protein